MAKSNGTLTDKQVSAWFEGLSFDRQVSLLESLSTSHRKIRNARIAELRRELAALDGNGHANGAANATCNRRCRRNIATQQRATPGRDVAACHLGWQQK